MKTLLVPTDFSENAANAIEYAMQIRVASQHRVVLLHVLTLTSSMEGKADDKLRTITGALQRIYPGMVIFYRIVRGENVPDQIVAAAELYQADLIVMGTKGISNLEKRLFGSNTATVIERSSCTVMSIPAKSHYRKPKRILYATNYEREDINAAVEIVRMIKPFAATLVIGHVLTDQDVEESEKNKIEAFIREVALISDYPRITYRLASENTVPMGLDLLIANTQADVIALRTHQRSLFEKIINPSITKKFAEESQIPVLAFHASASI